MLPPKLNKIKNSKFTKELKLLFYDSNNGKIVYYQKKDTPVFGKEDGLFKIEDAGVPLINMIEGLGLDSKEYLWNVYLGVILNKKALVDIDFREQLHDIFDILFQFKYDTKKMGTEFMTVEHTLRMYDRMSVAQLKTLKKFIGELGEEYYLKALIQLPSEDECLAAQTKGMIEDDFPF